MVSAAVAIALNTTGYARPIDIGAVVSERGAQARLNTPQEDSTVLVADVMSAAPIEVDLPDTIRRPEIEEVVEPESPGQTSCESIGWDWSPDEAAEPRAPVGPGGR